MAEDDYQLGKRKKEKELRRGIRKLLNGKTNNLQISWEFKVSPRSNNERKTEQEKIRCKAFPSSIARYVGRDVGQLDCFLCPISLKHCKLSIEKKFPKFSFFSAEGEKSKTYVWNRYALVIMLRAAHMNNAELHKQLSAIRFTPQDQNSAPNAPALALAFLSQLWRSPLLYYLYKVLRNKKIVSIVRELSVC